jgi:hypothetical protein
MSLKQNLNRQFLAIEVFFIVLEYHYQDLQELKLIMVLFRLIQRFQNNLKKLLTKKTLEEKKYYKMQREII